MNIIFKITYTTTILTVVIFFINHNVFGSIENNIIEEKYIETSYSALSLKDEEINSSLGYRKELINYYTKSKHTFYYHPESFEAQIVKLKDNIEKIILTNVFLSKISSIDIVLLKEKIDRRGKMKNKEIKLFGAKNDNTSEYISVFVHELAHYIDIYFLEKKVFLDISSKFYEISWQETKIKKAGMSIEDFVSGYAMTNKYEDFGESFTYYILHNKDFLQKTKSSSILKQKYDFFGTYIFKKKEFFDTKFNDEKVKDYYWDITKIGLDEKKLFKYLEKIESQLK